MVVLIKKWKVAMSVLQIGHDHYRQHHFCIQLIVVKSVRV